MLWFVCSALALDFDPPYLPVERYHYISQNTSFGSGEIYFDDVSYSNPAFKYPEMPKILLLPGDDAIIPFSMPPGDLDGIAFDFVVGKNFNMSYTLVEFDLNQGGWFSYLPATGGTFSGPGVLTGKLESLTFALHDLNPDYPGHGRHYPKPKLLGVRIKNNAQGILPLYIISYRTKMWVKTIEDAVR